MDDKKCGTCKHWRKREANPHNISDVRGDCMEGPPGVTTIIAPNGQIVGTAVSYPNMPPGFPACDKHEDAKPKLEIPT